MANPRFGWREVRTRTAHPCHWCPDEIPAGSVVPSWSCPSPAGVVRGWAHDYCDSETMAMWMESQGEDEILAEPDRGCIPRVLGFMSTREDRAEYVTRGLPTDESARLVAMWQRVHHGDLGELAGVRR
jgi:hypothetical protein